MASRWSRTWPSAVGDAVEERLAADEAVVGQQIGAVGQMLARAEADLEVERAVVAEQPLRGDLALRRHGDLRQQRVDQRLLALAQLVPARPAVEAVERGRVAGLVRGHGGAASRHWSGSSSRLTFALPQQARSVNPVER